MSRVSGVLRRDAQPADLDAFAAHLAGNYVPNTVIVDATASSQTPERYMDWMQARCLGLRARCLGAGLRPRLLQSLSHRSSNPYSVCE